MPIAGKQGALLTMGIINGRDSPSPNPSRWEGRKSSRWERVLLLATRILIRFQFTRLLLPSG
jgi:hypothetical protein